MKTIRMFVLFALISQSFQMFTAEPSKAKSYSYQVNPWSRLIRRTTALAAALYIGCKLMDQDSLVKSYAKHVKMDTKNTTLEEMIAIANIQILGVRIITGVISYCTISSFLESINFLNERHSFKNLD